MKDKEEQPGLPGMPREELDPTKGRTEDGKKKQRHKSDGGKNGSSTKKPEVHTPKVTDENGEFWWDRD